MSIIKNVYLVLLFGSLISVLGGVTFQITNAIEENEVVICFQNTINELGNLACKTYNIDELPFNMNMSIRDHMGNDFPNEIDLDGFVVDSELAEDTREQIAKRLNENLDKLQE